MRIIASFYKHDEVRFVSHLDMQRLFQRAFRRACLPLAYSKGFNPHPLLSFATALSVGYTSDSEYFDVVLSESMDQEEFIKKVNMVLPEGVRIQTAVDAGDFKTSLTVLMRSAEYEASLMFENEVSEQALKAVIDELMNGEIIVMKKTKGGIKSTDIRPMLMNIRITSIKENVVNLEIKGKLTAEGGLPLELLFGAVYERLGISATSAVNRKSIEMDWAVMA